MSQPQNGNTPFAVFLFILLLVLIGFGTQPGCRVEYGPPSNKQGGSSSAAPPPSGCVNSQPVYTTGPRLRGEFTVIVQEFPPRFHSSAVEYAEALRRRRINNFIFRRKNNKWVVAVGRYTTYDQADKMRDNLARRGFVEAEVFTPLGDILEVLEPPRPLCGCY